MDRLLLLYHASYETFFLLLSFCRKIWWRNKTNATKHCTWSIAKKRRGNNTFIHCRFSMFIVCLSSLSLCVRFCWIYYVLSFSLSAFTESLAFFVLLLLLYTFQANRVCVLPHTHKHTDTFIIGKINICLGSREFFNRSMCV